jgi:heme exporter protein A
MSNLIINNLSCIRGYNQLFIDLSFELRPGEILKISGTNGTGKTSLLKIIAGLNSAESGSIFFKNNDINNKLDIFYLGHLNALSPELSCIENLNFLLELGTENFNSSYLDALSMVGLNNYENELVANLSAGQKRRVALAALFITPSKLWLLDEPFTSLDSKGIEIVENQIKKHRDSGGLCILTTHQVCSIKNLRELNL